MIGVGLGLGLGLPLDLLLLAPVASGSTPPPPVGGIPLAWQIAAFPAGPLEPTASRGIGGVVNRGIVVALQRGSPNAVVLSAITDPERRVPVTPTSVAWRLLDGAAPRATGTFAADGTTWRAVIGAADVATPWPDARLEITVTPSVGASTVRLARVAFVDD